MQEADVQSQDPALSVHAHSNVMDLPALLVGADEVLAPVLGPLDGHPELARGPRHQNFLWIELHDLDAEAATDVRRDHVNAVPIQLEQLR